MIKQVMIEPIAKDFILPTYASDGDSGMDIYCPQSICIFPGERRIVKAGFKIHIPKHERHEEGYRWELQIRPRSGVSVNTRLIIANSPGTIDNFYIKEVGVIIDNLMPENTLMSNRASKVTGYTQVLEYEVPHGTIIIEKGERFAQGVFNEIVRPLEMIIGKIDTEHSRGEGFGGSGYK